MTDARRGWSVSGVVKRALTAATLFLIAGTAAAAWWPQPERGYLRVEVGERRALTVRAWWSGIWVLPWFDWTFGTSNPRVAVAEGVMKSSRPHDAIITGVAPGTTYLRIHPFDAKYTQIQVVCGKEDPIRAAEVQVNGTIGKPVTLEAVTPIAHRTTFAWYRGRVGDQSSPLPVSGPQIELIPQSTSETVWVLATTPCSTSSAEFLVTAHPSKRRSLRR